MGFVYVLLESVPDVGEFVQQLHGIPVLGSEPNVLLRILKVDRFGVVAYLHCFGLKPFVHVFIFGTLAEGPVFLTSLEFHDPILLTLLESCRFFGPLENEVRVIVIRTDHLRYVILDIYDLQFYLFEHFSSALEKRVRILGFLQDTILIKVSLDLDVVHGQIGPGFLELVSCPLSIDYLKVQFRHVL